MIERICGIELRLDRRQLGLEHPVREGIDANLDRLADRESGARLLRQGEVDVELVEIGEGDDRRAGVEILADIDLAHAELAGERRADQFLVDQRLGVGDAGAGPRRGRSRSDPRSAGRVYCWLASLRLRLQVDLREPGLGLKIGEIGLLRLVVELHQGIAGLHRRRPIRT